MTESGSFPGGAKRVFEEPASLGKPANSPGLPSRIELRRYRRYPLFTEAWLEAGELWQGEGRCNLSRSGIFIGTARGVPVNADVRVRLTLPDRSVLHLPSRVVRCVTPGMAARRSSSPGVGLEFHPLEISDAERLEALLRELDARPSPKPPLLRLRSNVVDGLMSSIVHSISMVSRAHPLARDQWRRAEVLRDIPYTEDQRRHHRLDIYRPTDSRGPWPGILYLHGGGFRSVPKETNWMMPLGFAHRGYLVFNINYRLAPRHQFPAAHVDAARAFRWILEHGPSYGMLRDQLAVAGDSAGANLALSLVVSSCLQRPEAFARSVYERGVTPWAAVMLGGLLEVRHPERLLRRVPETMDGIGVAMVEQMQQIERLYLGARRCQGADLADPVRLLEASPKLERPLCPIFASVGSRDPLIDDTRRAQVACKQLGGEFRTQIYESARHAFQAIIFRSDAQASWRDSLDFLAKHRPRR